MSCHNSLPVDEGQERVEGTLFAAHTALGLPVTADAVRQVSALSDCELLQVVEPGVIEGLPQVDLGIGKNASLAEGDPRVVRAAQAELLGRLVREVVGSRAAIVIQDGGQD